MDCGRSRKPSLLDIKLWYLEWSSDASCTFENHISVATMSLKSHMDIDTHIKNLLCGIKLQSEYTRT